MIERFNSLNPTQSLEGKQNYKTFHVIERDGSIVTSYRLDIPNSKLREEIVCKHFLSNYVSIFIKQLVGVNIVSRDQPWDFVVELSNNETFAIEITAIADNEAMFAKMKYEDRITLLTDKAEIQLHELERIHQLFPDTSTAALLVQHRQDGLNKKSTVLNPYYKAEKFIFDGGANNKFMPFEQLLKEAIDKKLKKNNSGKEALTLVIDNRTTLYEANDIINALEESQDYLETLPFNEVWIYTGYYSNLDGSNTEYSLVAAKVSQEKLQILYPQ